MATCILLEYFFFFDIRIVSHCRFVDTASIVPPEDKDVLACPTGYNNEARGKLFSLELSSI